MLKNEKGFTLIEMLVVLLIITVLILLIVPNIGKRADDMQDQGCDALIITVQAQADMYQLENNGEKALNISDLVDEYISPEQTTCQNGTNLTISNGVVTKE